MWDALRERILFRLRWIQQYLPGGGTGPIGWLIKVFVEHLLK